MCAGLHCNCGTVWKGSVRLYRQACTSSRVVKFSFLKLQMRMHMLGSGPAVSSYNAPTH